MALRLEVISRHRRSLGERGVKEFGQGGGTIGRSLESDWVLPDGQRFLSSRHASIDFRSGSYYIIDTSTNGVFINDADKPVGRGRPQRLFSNDRIRIGDYEILVEIDEAESLGDTLADSDHIDPVDLSQRVESPDPTSYDLVDAYEISGVGIEMLLDEDEADTLGPLRVETADLEGRAAAGSLGTQTETAQAKRGSQQCTARAPRTRSTPEQGTGASRALDTFLRGAGMPARQLEEGDAAIVLQNLGRLLREVVVGLSENLYLGAAQKTMLKQANTTMRPRGNNPLKLSASVDEALHSLLFRRSEKYLPAIDAVRDAFDDIKWHQRALVKGLGAAVPGYAGRLDPERLEEKCARGRTNALMGAATRFKYWDLYKDLYLVVTQHAEGELPEPFIEELAQAYARELARGRPRQTTREKTTAGTTATPRSKAG